MLHPWRFCARHVTTLTSVGSIDYLCAVYHGGFKSHGDDIALRSVFFRYYSFFMTFLVKSLIVSVFLHNMPKVKMLHRLEVLCKTTLASGIRWID